MEIPPRTQQIDEPFPLALNEQTSLSIHENGRKAFVGTVLCAIVAVLSGGARAWERIGGTPSSAAMTVGAACASRSLSPASSAISVGWGIHSAYERTRPLGNRRIIMFGLRPGPEPPAIGFFAPHA